MSQQIKPSAKKKKKRKERKDCFIKRIGKE